MSRYIDADLMQNFLVETNDENDWLVSQYNAGWIYSFIEDQPTVDAVPVVRCKDCKEYNTHDCDEGFGWCEMWDLGKTDDQFCSYGKNTDMRGDKR